MEPFTIAIIMMAVSAALSAASAIIQKQAQDKAEKELRDNMNADRGQEIKSNAMSTSEPMRIIYGTCRVGGNDVYTEALGKHSKLLFIDQVLSEGPIEGVDSSKIWVDNLLADGTKWSKNDRVNYELKTGTSDQTVAALINDFVSKYDDNLRNSAHIAWRLKYDGDAFRGNPKRQLLIKGRKVYDPRTETTIWSDNPAICLLDYMTNKRYGLGIDSDNMDYTSFMEAADYCDKVDPYDDRAGPKFKINMVVNVGESSAWEPVDNILALFRGGINYFNSNYSLRFADLTEETTQFTIEDEHIVQDEAGKSSIKISQPNPYDKPTGMRVNYINSFNDEYTEDSFIVGEDTGLVQEMDLIGCTDPEMARVLANSELERRQLNRVITGTFRDDLIGLEPHDVVTFNCTSLAIEDQAMRVMSVSYTQEGFVNLALQYENEDIYNDEYDTTIDDSYTTTLPDPDDPVILATSTISEETYFYRLRTFCRLNITFTVDEDEAWFDHVEVHVSTNGNVAANYVHQFNAVTDFSIDPVYEGETYFVKLRTVNTWGVKQDLEDIVAKVKTIEGISNQRPPSPAKLLISPGDNSISLSSTKLDDPDIEVYEFRLGAQWRGGIFMASLRSPNLDFKSVKPGTHSFTLNTKGTNGLYGEIEGAQKATTAVSLPKGWTYDDEYYNNYTDSTSEGVAFTNTEHTFHPDTDEDVLKCSHGELGMDGTTMMYLDSTANMLYGKYEGPVYDLGSSGEYFVYVDAVMDVVGEGTYWSDVCPDPVTWDDIRVTERTWLDIFEIGEAPNINITIKYATSLELGWSEVNRAELFAAVVTARYFQVIIEITDPSLEVNAMVLAHTLMLYK